MEHIKDCIAALREAAPEIDIAENELMRRHTTFAIGGPADLFVQPKTRRELTTALAVLRERNIPFLLLGNGSNMLVADAGIRGAVVCTSELDEVRVNEDNTVSAEAGALLSRIARRAQRSGLTGAEFAGGIPGTVGGAAVMNAGAYGGEMKDVLVEVTVMDADGNIFTIPAEKLELGYRTSIIKKAGYIVLEAKIRLEEGNQEAIRERMKELTIQRTTKQPLEFPSAGSTFKRPEGYFAGKLVMDSGLRGYQVGGARVSEKHCGFVINAGGATAKDVRTLMENVRDIVYKKYGVTLEPEVKFLGEFE